MNEEPKIRDSRVIEPYLLLVKQFPDEENHRLPEKSQQDGALPHFP